MGPCMYDILSPCENCGHCGKGKSKHGFSDEKTNCLNCDEVIYGGNTVFVYNNQNFCSVDCIYSYLEDKHEILETATSCETSCENCSEHMNEGEDVLEFDGSYFCNEDCLYEYIECLAEEKRLLTADDYEAEWGDRKYHEMKDEGLL